MGQTLLLLSQALLVSGAAVASTASYDVPSTPNKVGKPLEGFVSYSIEFSSFPEFAGLYC